MMLLLHIRNWIYLMTQIRILIMQIRKLHIRILMPQIRNWIQLMLHIWMLTLLHIQILLLLLWA